MKILLSLSDTNHTRLYHNFVDLEVWHRVGPRHGRCQPGLQMISIIFSPEIHQGLAMLGRAFIVSPSHAMCTYSLPYRQQFPRIIPRCTSPLRIAGSFSILNLEAFQLRTISTQFYWSTPTCSMIGRIPGTAGAPRH